MQTIIAGIIASDQRFKLIEDGDKIAVAVSGGKDSMVLMKALRILQDIYREKHNIHFELVAIHLKLNLCALDYEDMIQWFKDADIPLYIEDDQNTTEILRSNIVKKKIPCSLCSKFKKAIIISRAKKLNCNKIAMGHHIDDAIETLFMNLIFGGRFATFRPKMYMDRQDIWFIRPMALVHEKQIKKVISNPRNKLVVLPCGCPMDGFTTRNTMKLMLEKVFYNNPKFAVSRTNFASALYNEAKADLWFPSNLDNAHKIADDKIKNRKVVKNAESN